MTLPLPFPFMLGFLSCDTPMMLRLKCEPLGAPLPVMAFCAAATVVTVRAAATAAARWNVKRMSPPSKRYTCDKPHDTPSPVGHLAGATGLDRAVLSHGSQSLWTRVTARGVRCLTTVVAVRRRSFVHCRPTLWVTRHARRRLVL